MRPRTQVGSRLIKATTNGDARRRCRSWIESFVEHTERLESPRLYRQWAAIIGLSAILQQKVWLLSKQSALFPNLYGFLVGPPGIGKSETISAIGKYLREIEDFHVAPTSATGSSLIHALDKARVKHLPSWKGDYVEYNSMLLMPDELSALMHEYDRALVAALTTFYDVKPYTMTRVTGDVSIKIPHPQLSMLAGTTTSHLLKTVPEGAWDQGFMSRTIIIFSEDRPLQDDIFHEDELPYSKDLAHDLLAIYALSGQFRVSDEYRTLYNDWRKGGCRPVPSHPRLRHYVTRRAAQVLKLSMVSAVDRRDDLLLGMVDFERAIGWLLDAERLMPYTFLAASSIDARAIEEILHHMGDKAMLETQVVRFASNHVPALAVTRVLDLMLSSGMMKVVGQERNGLRYLKREG